MKLFPYSLAVMYTQNSADSSIARLTSSTPARSNIVPHHFIFQLDMMRTTKPEPRSCTWITKFLLFSAPVVIVEFQYNKYQNYIVIEVY